MAFARRVITKTLDLLNLQRHNDNFADIETDLTEHRGRLNNVETEQSAQSERIDNIVASGGESNIEIVDARQPATGPAYPILGDRLNAVDEQLADIEQQKADKTDLNATIALVGTKADAAEVAAQIAGIASGSPKGTYATASDLQAAFPSGNDNVYLVSADGKWYYWSGSEWAAGGVYQSTVIADGEITVDKVAIVANATINRDGNGTIVSVDETDQKGVTRTTTINYEANGLPVSVTQTGGGRTVTETLTYLNGNVTSIHSTIS